MLPVAPNTPARVVRATAALVVLAVAVDSVVTSTHGEIVAILVIFGVYLFGFAVVTAQWAPVSARGLAIGGITGVAAVVLPTLGFMVVPPAPVSGGWSLATVALAAVVAGALTARFAGPDAARQSDLFLSGFLAALMVALLLPAAVSLLAQVGPESWVPRMTSHALTPADRLAERRMLAGEQYLRTLLIGDLLALAIGVAALQLRTRRRRPTATPEPTQIELTR